MADPTLPSTSATIARACSIYADVGRIPVPTKARLISVPASSSTGPIVASVSYSTRDPIAHKKRTFHQTVVVGAGGVSHLSPAAEDDSMALDAFHPTAGYRAALRTVTVGDAKKRMVEVYTADGALAAGCNVTDVHGDFYTDDQIGGLAWSLNHSGDAKLAYIAEAKAPKRDKRPPVLVIVHVGEPGGEAEVKMEAQVVPLEYGKLSPSKPFFALGDSVVGFVGYERSPKVWGIAHCPNRLSSIYAVPTPLRSATASTAESVTLTLSPKSLTPSNLAARCPVVQSDNTARIAFLAVPIGGPHNTCADLHILDLTTGNTTLAIPAVRGTDQPGLFIDSLTPNGPQFTEAIVGTVHWRTVRTPVRLLPTKGSIDLLQSADQHSTDRHESVVVMTQSESQGHALVAKSGIIRPPSVVLNKFGSAATPSEVSVIPARVSTATLELLESLDVVTITFLPTLEAIVVRPKRVADTDRSPLVIVPHGGPHSAYANEWSDVMSPQAVGLAAGAGYTVAYVNYTGSSGYGKDSIDALIGNIGNLEVKECHQVAERLIQDYPGFKLDKDNVFFLGGSHSGLIGTFIAAQYPGFYRAVVIRNPVTSLGTFTGTDILDWSFAEAGLPHDLRKPSLVTPHAYAHMWSQSGVSVIDKVNTPTLVLLGAKDARVPTFQGLEWAAWLKGNKPEVPVRVMQFADAGHGLESMDAQRFGFEATIAFFEEFRTRS
ncbi:Alpha/Beta hydrolase protein [Catenaria anguillulae PL171]|uniref:Dipeptidyl-peptidase V n=1 Tax=Catenaria anguillulae PL171 TaxID=765915 RepID=A0A1Y2HR58_9FUNG|nr:Alpha/Beta hydrolase protein [Catenaria anguillulae PL171]